MGKKHGEQQLPTTSLDAQGTTRNSGNSNRGCLNCTKLKKLVTFRCIFVLVLGFAVLLSACFWLPFFHFGHRKDLDLDFEGRNIVASFLLKKPTYILNDYKSQLQDDIFDEISFSTTNVEILHLQPLDGSNTTKVVFAVDSDMTTQSLIRASFVSLVTEQSFFHLSTPYFGDPFSFEVLKFKGGITASPDQKAFLMQKVQIIFNFTLNFSIDQILYNFDDLTSQLKSGLRLAPNENLYVSLTNHKGSTVDPPTIVQSRVLLAVGRNPSTSRLKQLTQTIKGSQTQNLGLNNTVFGRVKQVHLSSVNLGHDGSGTLSSPSPSPSSPPHHHHHRHHHHHHHHRHHHRHHGANLAPSISPTPPPGQISQAPIPAPLKGRVVGSPNYHTSPIAPPVYAPHPAPSQPKVLPVPVASPSPNFAHSHTQPPSTGELHAGSSNAMVLVSSSTSPCIFSSKLLALVLFLLVGLQL